jgi:DNA repair exonuclease SbcCD nuclease subunit
MGGCVVMLLLHVSDTHLGASRPSKLRERELDYYDVFNEVVDIAVREHVDAVIHGGDFFDEPKPTPQTYLYAYRALRKLREHGIEFLVVAGQHDQPKVAQLPPLRVLSEIGLLRLLAQDKPETHIIKLHGGELGVVAIPYLSPVTIGEYLKTIKVPETSKRILLAHLLLKELNMPSAHASLAELGADKYNYIALGDYHLKYETKYMGIPSVYPGSTEAGEVLEASSERYVVLVDLSGSEAIVNWVKLNTPRKWIIVEAKSYMDIVLNTAASRLEKYTKPPILYIRVKSKLSEIDVKRIREYLNKLLSENKILVYRVEVEIPSASGSEIKSIVEEALVPQTSTLDQVVYSVLGDRELAELVLNIVKSSESSEAVKFLVERVLEDEKVLNKIKKLVG